MKCLKGYCRSPMACGSFGYCRERNFDGYPMSQSEVNRRRAEQEASELSVPVTVSRNIPFTKAQVRRAVQAAESTGKSVRGFRIAPDGTIIVEFGDVERDKPEKQVERRREIVL